MIKYLYISSDIIAYFQWRLRILRHNKRQAPWDRQRCASSSWQVFLLIFFQTRFLYLFPLGKALGLEIRKAVLRREGKIPALKNF